MFLIKLIFTVLSIASQFLSIWGDSVKTILDQPTMYKLGARSVNVTDEDDCFIYITSSDVVLDMEHTTLNYTGTVIGFTGIKIAPGVSRVTIKNVIFNNLTGSAIYISDACSEIIMEKIIVNSCNGGGVVADGTVYGIGGISITESSISTCTGVANGPAYGAILNKVSNVNITHSYFTYNSSQTAPAYGIYLNSCDTCHFIQSAFAYNCGTPLSTGAYLFDCKDCQFLYCAGSFNYLTDNLSSSSAIGFVFDSCHSSGIAQSVSIENGGPLGTGIGYKLFNGSGNIMKECSAQGNFGGSSGIGFYFGDKEDSSHIFESYAISNKGGDSGYGIFIDGATNCTVLDNKLNNNSGTVSGLAYLDTSTSNTNIIKHNLYYKNSTQADVD